MAVRVKICGLTSADAARATVAAGADYIGLNFFAPSPRSVTPEQAAAIAAVIPPTVITVGLMVDPDDALVDRVAAVPVDMLQLHGSESPERVSEIRARTGLRVMKVIGVREAADLDPLDGYLAVADQIMLDAKAPRGAALPGGNGLVFDWRLIAGRKWDRPWMLAGGLTPENVSEAIRLTDAPEVDVSSGVESAPGVKDPALVAAFIGAAR